MAETTSESVPQRKHVRLVLASTGLAAVVAVWVLAKALKWTLLLAFGAIVVVLVLSGLFWLFG